MQNTTITILKESIKKFGNHLFLFDKTDEGWQGKGLEDLDQQSDYIAAELRHSGLKKADKVALLSEGRSAWVISEFGIIKAGCVSVPLSVKLNPEEIIFRLNHSETKALFISKNNIDKLFEIWNKIHSKRISIIILDTEKEEVLSRVEEKQPKVKSHLRFLSDIIAAGKELVDTGKIKPEILLKEISEDDLVNISYTSGTTGNPKGIMLSHLNYYANTGGSFEFFYQYKNYRTLVILPLDHSFAHTVAVFVAMLNGMQLYFTDARGGNLNILKNIPSNLKEVKPHILFTVPALTGNFMNKITEGVRAKGKFAWTIFNLGMKSGMAINRDGYRKSGFFTRFLRWLPYKLADAMVFSKVREIFGGELKFCVGGGALLDISQQKFFYTLGVPVYQGYGLSEATPIISANNAEEHKLGSSGKVLPNIICKIVKSDGTNAKAGETGEITIKGDNVMKGYYKNPEATAEALVGSWLKTGDLGYLDKDGFLVVTGREKALLISADGEKYSPEGIEGAITNTSEMTEQVMLYNDHSKFTTALITLNEAEVRNYVKTHKPHNASELLKALTESVDSFRNAPEYKNQFASKWFPAAYRIIGRPFSEADGLINSTMKMVRYKITERYRAEIDSMYTGDCKTQCPENVKALEKFFQK
jgi:long-chain acyl-CoA synthetase